MKCFALLAALCFLGVCAGDSLSLDFLNQNLLSPMLDQIYNNAINMLGSQLTGLLSGLFGGIGKRGLSDVLGVNLSQVLAPFVAQVKEIYQRVFTVFLQIVQNVDAWISKPDWARIEFVRAGADAEAAVARLNLGAEFLKPLIDLVQQHLSTLITDFEGIIAQVFNAAQHPLQSLIGAGSLLQP